MGNTSKQSCQVLVVGGGPGGYVTAIRAGQLGLDTVLIDADGLGGTCLNRGCIPSKALIHAANTFSELAHHHQASLMGIALERAPALDFAAMIAWKDGIVGQLNSGVAGLLKKAGVRVIQGYGVFSNARTCTVAGKGEEIEITAEHVVLATGSVASEIPDIPFGGNILSSTEALALEDLPRSLIVVGGGYIGLELGTVYAKLGTKVTVIEATDRLLPQFDKDLVRPVLQGLAHNGVDVHLNSRLKSVADKGKQVVASFTNGDDTTVNLKADKVLVTVGRRPATTGWGLENMAVDMDGPFVRVDDQCRTAMKNVWAIGDIVGEPMLAHKATAQGEMVAEIIAGQRRRFEPRAIPSVCFTDPEIVSVGLSPDDAKARGEDIITGRFPFAANGKALSMNASATGGFVRVVARKSDHLVLGIQGVGAHIAEMSGEFALALEMAARLEDIAGTIHAHPTLGEATLEASLAAMGHALHIA